ncbi:MAG: branched-chain amino acid ABC transporter permease [Bacteroidetes bacterium]|nr:MAG: branched-chain amino acid ABC transporter permease [Bacteroidota bacterium]
MIQLLVNSVITFGLIIIVTISFSFIYKVTKFFHFAHAVVFTSGAYFTFLFKVWLGFPLFIAIPLAVACSTILGCAMDLTVYRTLRKRKATSLVLLLASLGLNVVIQNVISMVLGDDTKSIRTGDVQVGIEIFGAYITPTQIGIIITSIVLVILTAIFLKYAKFGKAMRAVSNNPELALISGIDSERTILYTFALGSALAGIAGILVALDVDMTPTMGMNALMMGVVAMIIGGVNSITGIVFGSLLLALAQNFGVWKISSQWQDAIAFIILFLFLLIKPEGFLGKKIKKVSV